jgi:hypothetical protein
MKPGGARRGESEFVSLKGKNSNARISAREKK